MHLIFISLFAYGSMMSMDPEAARISGLFPERPSTEKSPSTRVAQLEEYAEKNYPKPIRNAQKKLLDAYKNQYLDTISALNQQPDITDNDAQLVFEQNRKHHWRRLIDFDKKHPHTKHEFQSSFVNLQPEKLFQAFPDSIERAHVFSYFLYMDSKKEPKKQRGINGICELFKMNIDTAIRLLKLDQSPLALSNAAFIAYHAGNVNMALKLYTQAKTPMAYSAMTEIYFALFQREYEQHKRFARIDNKRSKDHASQAKKYASSAIHSGKEYLRIHKEPSIQKIVGGMYEYLGKHTKANEYITATHHAGRFKNELLNKLIEQNIRMNAL